MLSPPESFKDEIHQIKNLKILLFLYLNHINSLYDLNQSISEYIREIMDLYYILTNVFNKIFLKLNIDNKFSAYCVKIKTKFVIQFIEKSLVIFDLSLSLIEKTLQRSFDNYLMILSKTMTNEK